MSERGMEVVSFALSFILLSSLSSWSLVCCENERYLSVFDDLAVSDFPLETKGNISVMCICAQLCNKDNRCRSLRYNENTRVCSTYGAGYSLPEKTFKPTSAEPGSKLYLMCGKEHSFGTACTEDTDCNYCNPSCRNGSCECALGFSYDVTTGSCVMRCQSYGAFFTKFPNHGIDYCNKASNETFTAEECMESCRRQTFECVNVEYKWSTGKCHMCDKIWFDIDFGDRVTDEKEYDLYYRHCSY